MNINYSRLLFSGAEAQRGGQGSGVSRVKVTRLDKKTGKPEIMIVDQVPFRQSSKPLSDDIFLLDGDIIEVPEKQSP